MITYGKFNQLKKEVYNNKFRTLGLLIIILAFSYAFKLNIEISLFEQTILQSQSLLSGSLSIDPEIFGNLDVSYNNEGEAFWPLGIMPAILITPIVFFADKLSLPLTQGILLPFITLTVFYLAYSLARKWFFTIYDSIFLAAAFCLGSAYILMSVVPFSWFFSQSIGVLVLLFALNEWYGKKRIWLIGIFMGLLLNTRYVSSLAIIFFIIEILSANKEFRKKLVSLIAFGIPIIISLLFLLQLNYLRFDNPFDTGYTITENGQYMGAARVEYGFFSPKNFVNNFYWYFLATPTPVINPVTLHIEPPYLMINPIGYGFFFLSPLFLYILIYFQFNRETRWLWVVSLLELTILLFHFTTGYQTFGPRYIMDLLPLWYVILLISVPKKLSNKQLFIILLSIVINIILISYFPFLHNPCDIEFLNKC